MTVNASHENAVASAKIMRTRATLSNDGLLTVETFSKSDSKTQGLKGHVAIVVYDANGNAIGLFGDHTCTTRCSTLDPTCPSSGTNVWTERFSEEVGKNAHRLEILHSDSSLGSRLNSIINTVTNILTSR